MLDLVWQGKVPLQITSYGNAFFTFAPRCSYLQNITLPSHFIQDSTARFSSSSTPLPFNYPIGLLYDIHVLPNSRQSKAPWKLELVWIKEEGDAKSSFFFRVKECDWLENGNVKKSMGLSKQDTLDLWDSLVERDFTRFKSVKEKLITEGRIHVAFRIYHKGEVFQNLVKWEEGLMLVDLVKNFTGDAYTHGIKLPREIMVKEMVEMLVYPDGFLHIVVF